MTIESAADLLGLLSDFGETATVGRDDVTAIFDEDYVEVLDIAGTRPLLYCRTSDVSTVSVGDNAEAGGAFYTIVGIQPDGTGLTMLVLEEI